MLPANGIGWAAFSSAPVSQTSAHPTRVPTFSMFSIITRPPTVVSTPIPSLLKTVSQQASPTPRPNTPIPTAQPSVQPTITPSFRPSPDPTLVPTQVFVETLNPTTENGVSSVNSASNGQTGVSSTAIGIGVGCIIIALIVVGVCVFATRKNSKEKLSPYQVWSAYYSNRDKQNHNQNHNENHNQNNNHNENIVIHPPVRVKEDIHHFYNKSPRPSINQNTVFTPHVSGRISTRNSQIVSQIGTQKNMQRLSISRGPSLHNI
jgi:hypothetical protein